MRFGILADEPLSEEEHEGNYLPDSLACRRKRDISELERAATEPLLLVATVGTALGDYGCSIKWHTEIVYEEAEHSLPAEILDGFATLELATRHQWASRT